MNKIKYHANLCRAQTERSVQEIADKVGILIPSTHTEIFIAQFFEIETANGNGVRLSKTGVEKALPGIIGSQINLEHDREDFVGIVLDAWIEGNVVFGAFTFAKNMYPVEFDKAVEQFNKGELGVSFELFADVSTSETLSDGTRRLNDLDFQGMGLLIQNKPAYPTSMVLQHARLYKQMVQRDCRETVFAKKVTEGINKFVESLDDEPMPMDMTSKIFIVTTSDDSHFHVAEVDMDGNGETITGHGEGKHPDPHIIRRWQIQEAPSTISSEPHTHAIMNEIMASIKEHLRQKKSLNKSQKIDEKTEGGSKIMTEEQKARISELRTELGDFVKELTDEQLLDEAKVEEVRKTKAEAEKVEAEKTELSKAQERIKELESEIETLKATLEAKDSEVEAVREQATKVATLKIELKDNPHVAEFKDEDYLNEVKVAEAKRLHEIDLKEAEIKKKEEELKAKEEALKKKTEEKASQDELEAGSENNEPISAVALLQKRYIKK